MKNKLIILVLITCAGSVVNAQKIIRKTNDSLIGLTGSTYAFTVDTPADSGLVSTQPSERELLLLAGSNKKYKIGFEPAAVGGQLWLDKKALTANTVSDLAIYFAAGQRTPNATVKIFIPSGINITEENTTVNVIGRGAVKLKDLATQSIGRVGTNYPYHKVGNFAITKQPDGSSLLLFKHLDLRPSNGPDLTIVISNVSLGKTGNYNFRSNYTTAKPEVLTSPGIGAEITMLTVTPAISDLQRIPARNVEYTSTSFAWSALKNGSIQLMQSTDNGKTWSIAPAKINSKEGIASISNLAAGKLYSFKLSVKDGPAKGFSNIVHFYSGMQDIKNWGVVADGIVDNTEKINTAIEYIHSIGGGTLLFSEGIYNVRTVHLQSNVYLYVAKGAAIKAIKGTDAPETTWFSDKAYRSGLSPTDKGPYEDPENYMTKQDVGHHYFHNSMFFGERLDNVKIIGNGYITGNGNLVTGDNVMKNPPDNRGDKMFTLKLCTNIEIGGIAREDDLWYDSTRDEPYYINKDGSKDFNTDNMLHIDRAGHFALLATGTDNLSVHDTYFAKDYPNNARDVYDFMQCNNVRAINIYSRVSSDDIIKPGSDCSLGFTRPAAHYIVRNIIGDTNCNLFQIGSETADDIMDIHVDNIYVLGANKAGFSISTNDGAHIKDIHLNCGHTGPIHSRSKMFRTFTPFFISISSRGRIIGASVARFKFTVNGVKHDELLVTNVNIGEVENIILNGIDVNEVYAGSSFGGKNERWKPYDGSQRKTSPIVAGYKLPDSLNFTLPDSRQTGYIKNIVFNDVNILVKGGNPASDTSAIPPELGVGQYNASNLNVLPSYGLWARHVQGLTVVNCSFKYEKPDGRYPVFLDDVLNEKITGIKYVSVRD